MTRSHLSTINLKSVARRFRRAWPSRAQTGTRWLIALAYLTLSLGIPLPMPVGGKSHEPYPCMNHPCGCSSAEQCWRHCCCTTLEQRLAWARDNHVTPPDYALVEARGRGIDWETYCRVGADHESHLCRAGEEVAPTCCEHTSSEHKYWQTKHESTAHGSTQKACPPPGIVWLEALACSGCDQNWLGISVSLPPPTEVRLVGPANVVELAASASLPFSSHSFAPPTPPPRPLAA